MRKRCTEAAGKQRNEWAFKCRKILYLVSYSWKCWIRFWSVFI